MSDFDVAIIGGGLAGCSAAIPLAQAGWRVGIFEAKSYPRHKVCGEFLSPECSDLLNNLGVKSSVQALQPPAIETMRITTPDQTTWQTRLPQAGFGLSRFALDEILAQQAADLGVEIHTMTRVTDFYGSLDDTFCLSIRSAGNISRVSARLVLAAPGKHSSLDRRLDHSTLAHPFVGLKAHFNGPPLTNRIELHTFPGGYCGLSEIENYRANACLLVQQDVFQRITAQAAEPIDTFIQWIQDQNPALRSWLSNATRISERWHSVSQVSFARKPLIENDILRVGDSAGMIAPLAGNGMAMALEAGQMAAFLAHRFLAELLTAADLKRQYRQQWRQRFQSRLVLGQFLQRITLHPRWLSPGLHLLNALPALGKFFISQTRSSQLISS